MAGRSGAGAARNYLCNPGDSVEKGFAHTAPSIAH
jgi:hypothetical protein